MSLVPKRLSSNDREVVMSSTPSQISAKPFKVLDLHGLSQMCSEYRLTGEMRRTRFVCISDTHGQTPRLPKGDVLIHAGDLSNQGGFKELKKTVEWLEKAASDFEEVIVIAGSG